MHSLIEEICMHLILFVTMSFHKFHRDKCKQLLMLMNINCYISLLLFFTLNGALECFFKGNSYQRTLNHGLNCILPSKQVWCQQLGLYYHCLLCFIKVGYCTLAVGDKGLFETSVCLAEVRVYLG